MIAAVSKTVYVLRTYEGSNPSSSAIESRKARGTPGLLLFPAGPSLWSGSSAVTASMRGDPCRRALRHGAGIPPEPLSERGPCRRPLWHGPDTPRGALWEENPCRRALRHGFKSLSGQDSIPQRSSAWAGPTCGLEPLDRNPGRAARHPRWARASRTQRTATTTQGSHISPSVTRRPPGGNA